MIASYTVIIGLLAVYFSLAVTVCTEPRCSESTATWINVVGQMTLIVVSLRHVYLSVRLDTNSILTPFVVFPVGAAIFFGFGNMSAFFATDFTIAFFQGSVYGITVVQMLRANLLTLVGMTIALIAFLFISGVRFTRWRRSYATYRRFSIRATATAFLVGGAALKYGLLLPNDWGISARPVPGALTTLRPVIDLGFAIAGYLMARGDPVWRMVFWLAWPVHLGITSLEWSKRAVVIAILLPGIGAFLAHRNWRRFMPWLIAASVAYGTLQDVNTTARLTVERNYALTGTNVGDRASIMLDILTGRLNIADVANSDVATAQVWWLRLNYAGAQVRAMELYDAGIPGDWTLSFAAVIVPRFLWPDKPVAVAQGRVFHRLVTGNDEARARVGMTIYGDGYWQMGWFGVALFSAVSGGIMGFLARFSIDVLKRREFIYLPVVFLGLQMSGQGPTGTFQIAYVGALPILLGYIALIALAKAIFLSSTRPRRGDVKLRYRVTR